MRSARTWLWPLAVLGVAGCLPLTFSNDGELDFDRFSSVFVATVPGGTLDSREYLARELRRSSGFATVTTSADVAVDLDLFVEVEVVEDITIGEDGFRDIDWDARATFVASTPAGVIVDEGSVRDSSQLRREAIEDVLDEVVHHFLFPYRF